VMLAVLPPCCPPLLVALLAIKFCAAFMKGVLLAC